MFKDKTLLITGGTGYFRSAVIKKFLGTNNILTGAIEMEVSK